MPSDLAPGDLAEYQPACYGRRYERAGQAATVLAVNGRDATVQWEDGAVSVVRAAHLFWTPRPAEIERVASDLRAAHLQSMRLSDPKPESPDGVSPTRFLPGRNRGYLCE